METPHALNSVVTAVRHPTREGRGPAVGPGRLSAGIRSVLVLLACGVVIRPAGAAEDVPPRIAGILSARCAACHDAADPKGGVRLDNLAGLALPARLDLLNKIQEQVFSDEMPPKTKLSGPDSEALLKWAAAELAVHKASRLEDKLRFYRYGNYVNHNKLFSGEIKDMPFTPARRWRINEMIYAELVYDVLELNDLRKRPASLYGVVKPFNLPTDSGVRYYDTETVENGQFLTLLANAGWIAGKQLRAAAQKSGDFKFPETYSELLKENTKEAKAALRRGFPDEQWNPGRTAAEFEKVLMAKGKHTEADLRAAISRQFGLALQRKPSAEEMDRYLRFTNDAIATGGTAKGLERMLVSVLMETDFLYRSELGDGRRDAHGRMMLAPREAAYAIAYALTDRPPDATLLRAADTGALSTRDDYRREVLRLLQDDSIAKPRLLRFFQDWFGYYNVFNVFKDEERFVGAYNPHRVVSTKFIWRVPGKVSREADAVVSWILKQDKDVLGQLLTTDKFFVQHTGDNDEMVKLAAKAAETDKVNRATYELLKGLSGKALGEAARKHGLYTDKDGNIRRALFNDMAYFSLIYGKDTPPDRRPIPRDSEGVEHSLKMYDIDFRTWSYEPVQPVRVENRMGMLTHPAWLVSFSQNAHTDPVRRGRWIREKLLAGIIQDIPVTVDAKIPEDPHKTLRQRLTVTEQPACWSCHRRMNPLGNPFESFDDFGRHRTVEEIEYPENIVRTTAQLARDHNGIVRNYQVNTYKTLPVDPRGHLDGTGDKTLDGEVKDAPDLISRLARSDRVRQSFVRNVFRYFMGRNEMLSDSRTLIAADKAYVESGGSFKALVVSLLTSDSFIYRK